MLGFVLGSYSNGSDSWQSPHLQDHPLAGKIIEQETGHVISSDDLINRLNQYATILVGEKHDNPDHHVIESKLIAALVGQQTTVVFEMLDDRDSSVVPNLSADLSLKQLEERLQWSEKRWPWADYGPLFLQVVQQGGTLKAGNIERAKIMGIYSQGLDSLKQLDRFDSITRVQKALQAPLLDLVYEAHCGKMDKEKLQPMVDIQLAKDASMAFALESSETPKRLIIAGGIHVRKDVGIPRHFLRPNESATLLMIEVDKEKQGLQEYPSIAEDQADFVWFTPKFTEEDYCSRLD